MFSQMFVCPQEGEYLGRYTPPPGRYTHPPLPGRYTPLAGTPPRQVPPGSGTPPRPRIYPPLQVHPQAGTPPREVSSRFRYTPRQVHPWGQVPPRHSACWDTVNKWAVHIPLECILVHCTFCIKLIIFVI